MIPKLASIEQIVSIIPHPDADSLDIARVLGYQAIVPKGKYHKGDLIVFIQPDTVLPDDGWASFYKAKSSRVKAIRLRGEWSMGIVESLSILPENPGIHETGQDVSEILGVTKYEPPIPNDLNAKGNLPFSMPKTDEERYQNLEHVPFGSDCDVTLKIDGSSMTVYYDLDTDTGGVTSRSLELKLDSENKYTLMARKLGLIDKLRAYCQEHKVSLALRGELYGEGVQTMSVNPHCRKPLGFAAFSTYDLKTGKYCGRESVHYFDPVCRKIRIETVPVIERNVTVTGDLIRKYDEELTQIDGVPFEGVVLKLSGGRSFKIINKHYDSKK